MATSAKRIEALEIPEILGLIFQHLGCNDLKSVRLVNLLWSVHGWTKLITNSVTRINEATNLQAFIDLFSENEHPPQNYAFDLEAPKNAELVTQLYEKFGPHMRELDISGYVNLELDHQDQEHLTNLEIFSFTPHEVEFPILPSLVLNGPNATVNIFNSIPDQSVEEFEHLGKFLAQQSETLVHLHFDDEHSLWTGASPAPLVKAIVDARFMKLQSLDIRGAFDSETFTKLTEGDVKCKKLRITFNCEAMPSPNALKSFMHAQSATLEELSISSTHSTEPGTSLEVKSYIPFPNMHKLRSLRMCKCAGALDFATGTSFPCLQELQLDGFEWANSYKFVDPNPAVRKCKVWFDNFKTETRKDIMELIENASRMFPNLEALSIISTTYGQLTRGHVQQIRDYRMTQRFAHLKKVSLTPCRRNEEKVLEDALTEKTKLRF